MLQRLKAALDDAVASFLRRPENVAQLWDRLVRSVVVQPRGLHESSGALPRADITYQLNEIEVSQRLCIGNATKPPLMLGCDAAQLLRAPATADGARPLLQARAEDYSETLAFVRLLSALMQASGGVLPDEGRPYAHFAEFVRLDLLGRISQRGYR